MLGVLNKDEFDIELAKIGHVDEPIKIGEVIPIVRGRGKVNEIPNELRKVIATEALVNGHAREISKVFGISESSVNAYKNGVTSTVNFNERENTELGRHVELVKDGIVKSARSKLMLALESLTDEKVQNSKARDIASIAKDMSVVMKNTEPALVSQITNQVLVYSPKIRDEDEYDVIVANE